MWKFLPNFFFSAFADSIVLSKYTRGSPPVIPAPFAFESIASWTTSFTVLQDLSFAQSCTVSFLPSDKEQYQQFLEHLPPTNRTSFWPLRHSLHPRHMSLFM